MYMFSSRQVVQDETRLEKSRLSAPYRQRLSKGLTHFLLWLQSQNSFEGQWLFNIELVNQIFSQYLAWCFYNKVNFSLAQHALLAFQSRHGHLKGHMSRAWDSVKAWKLQLPQSHRLPMPMQVLQALFGVLLDCAIKAPAGATWTTVAILTRVAFFGLLRPGEMLKLRRCDLKFMTRDDQSEVLIIGILDPKNRSAMGRTQFATIADAGTVLWAKWLFNRYSPLTKLWPATKEKFLSVFRTGLRLCHASSMNLTLGSLRPGGTTHLYINGTEVHRIKLAGRWANEQSLTHYIQEAMSYMVWGTLSVDQEHEVKLLAETSSFAWLKPPCPEASSVLIKSWQWQPPRKPKSRFKP